MIDGLFNVLLLYFLLSMYSSLYWLYICIYVLHGFQCICAKLVVVHTGAKLYLGYTLVCYKSQYSRFPRSTMIVKMRLSNIIDNAVMGKFDFNKVLNDLAMTLKWPSNNLKGIKRPFLHNLLHFHTFIYKNLKTKKNKFSKIFCKIFWSRESN